MNNNFHKAWFVAFFLVAGCATGDRLIPVIGKLDSLGANTNIREVSLVYPISNGWQKGRFLDKAVQVSYDFKISEPYNYAYMEMLTDNVNRETVFGVYDIVGYRKKIVIEQLAEKGIRLEKNY